MAAFLILSIAINGAVPLWDLVSDSLNQRCRNMNHSAVLTEFDSKHVPAIRLSYYLQGFVLFSRSNNLMKPKEHQTDYPVMTSALWLPAFILREFVECIE